MQTKKEQRTLDRTDRQILALLQRNGRITNVELAKQVHLSPTPCLERVKRLERDGYITDYCARLCPEKIGLATLVLVQISLSQGSLDVFDRFNNCIKKLDEIVECHMIAGNFDYLLKVRVANMAHFRRFMSESLNQLPGVTQTHSYVVMEEIKTDEQLPLIADLL